MIKTLVTLAFFLFLALPTAHAEPLSSNAEEIFKKYSSALVQIECVSTKSNKKYAVGSGFQISPQGHIVTNYHVVSDVVISPWSFHIRVVHSNGTTQMAAIQGIDVVHDLAIIKVPTPLASSFSLGASGINKGRTIFAMGNPHDLGMTIIEGLSNGYMDKALYQKILTSLALNPGMSGGPTVDESGQVIGVNVATAGNDISFLVPVEFLKKLWLPLEVLSSNPPLPDTKVIQAQLLVQEQDYFKGLLSKKWDEQRFGNFVVPSAISTEFTCWGAPYEDNEWWIKRQYLQCQTADEIFISHALLGHQISFNYSSLSSVSQNAFRFYNLTEDYLKKGYQYENDSVREDDAENFKCRTDRVAIAQQPFWVSTCTRKLKKFPLLYDTNVMMASLGEESSMLVVEITLSAISKERTKEFLQRFYESIRWRK